MWQKNLMESMFYLKILKVLLPHMREDKKELAEIKLKTTDIEKKYSKDGKRTINLDPGCLSESELVLASFKKGTNYKEQVSDKVWLHKVLEFDGKEVKVFWHTFPDYRGRGNQEFFKRRFI